MSRSVDLFIASPEPLELVAAKLGEVAHLPAVEGPDATWVVSDGETSATLAEHHYLDDGDLFLSRYRYVVSGRVPATARPQDTPVAALLRRIGCEIQRSTAWPVLLVLDLQYRETLPRAEPAGQAAQLTETDEPGTQPAVRPVTPGEAAS